MPHKPPNHTKPAPITEPAYPLPSYAATIWLSRSGNELIIVFPSSLRGGKSHTVRLPVGSPTSMIDAVDVRIKAADPADRRYHRSAKTAASTYHQLVDLLEARHRARESKEPIRIGEPGALTQAQLFQMAGYSKAHANLEARNAAAARKAASKELAKRDPEAWLREAGLIP